MELGGPKRMEFGPCGGVRPDGQCEMRAGACAFHDMVPWSGVQPAPRRVRAPVVLTDFSCTPFDGEDAAATAAVLASSCDAVLVGEHQNKPLTDVEEFAHLTDTSIESLGVELDAIRQDFEDARGERVPGTSTAPSPHSARWRWLAGSCWRPVHAARRGSGGAGSQVIRALAHAKSVRAIMDPLTVLDALVPIVAELPAAVLQLDAVQAGHLPVATARRARLPNGSGTNDQPAPGGPALADGDVVSSADYELFWSLSFALTAAVNGNRKLISCPLLRIWRRGHRFRADRRAGGVPMRWVGGAHAFHQFHSVSDPPVEHLHDIVRNATVFHQRWGLVADVELAVGALRARLVGSGAGAVTP